VDVEFMVLLKGYRLGVL